MKELIAKQQYKDICFWYVKYAASRRLVIERDDSRVRMYLKSETAHLISVRS